jgi:hypothetical protein
MSGSNWCIPRNEPLRSGQRVRHYYYRGLGLSSLVLKIGLATLSLLNKVFNSIYYIPRIGLPVLLQPNRQTDPGDTNINRSQTHECRNWERGCAVSFLGIHKSDFRYSVGKYYDFLILQYILKKEILSQVVSPWWTELLRSVLLILLPCEDLWKKWDE